MEMENVGSECNPGFGRIVQYERSCSGSVVVHGSY